MSIHHANGSDPAMRRTATLSYCESYRYVLGREWGGHDSPCVGFIGLNPSTADHTKDDRTLRRCVAFARSWGYGQMVLVNLYAWRETDPDVMFAMRDRVDLIGPENDHWLTAAVASCFATVAAWGSDRRSLARAAEVKDRYRGKLWCLRTTKDGHPNHPLYLPGDLKPMPYDWGPL